jgi:outer membrane receptor protein involved in Fe transport
MSYKYKSAGSALAALLAVSAPLAWGQAAPATASANKSDDEETIVLSPFVIESTEDADTYSAKSTLAGTRIRTELKDVGSAISVYTGKFLQDTNSRKADDLLVYTTGTEVAGQGGNFLGQGDGAVLTNTNRTAPVQNTRVRGLAEADNTRDFFLSDIPWDSYNVGRVDLQRGPNAILFGIGSPAGIVNSSLNTASFRDSNKVEAQYGSYASTRFTGDFNKVLLKNELALRVALLKDDTNYRQDPAYKDDERIYAAIKWDPSFLAKNGMRTSLRANYENGHIDSNLPRSTPPLDAITPWYSVLGKRTLDARYATTVINSLNTPERNWYGAPGGRVFDGVITAFNGGSQGISYPSQVTAYPNYSSDITGSGAGDNTIRGVRTYNEYANASFPEGAIGAYKAKSLTDRSVFDFYNNLLEGPNKNEFNDFDAFNVALTQTFLDSKAGFELVYDKQDAKWGYNNFLSGDASVITVDLMDTLADGSRNPNVGRPMTISGGGSAGLYRAHRIRETQRATAYYDLDFGTFTDKTSTVARLLGHHVFTGLLSRQENDFNSRSGPRFFLSEEYPAVKRGGDGTPNPLSQASRDDIFYNYLGGSISGLNNPSGINLVGVKDRVQPQGTSSINVWNNVTRAWTQVPLIVTNNDLASDEAKQYTNGVKSLDRVDSKALVWQGYLLDGNLVPMYGWRKDKDRFISAGTPNNIRAVAQVNDPNWRLPANENDLNKGQRKWNIVEGESRTWSIVAHAPKQLMQKLPGQLGLSVYYNKSENFQPDAGRRDIFGTPVASPSGETKDYGVTITALDEKVTLKINHFKTSVINANVAGEIGGQYLIGAVEGWGQQAAVKFRDSSVAGGPRNWPASELYGVSSSGNPVTWRPAGPLKGTSGAYTYTQAELDAAWAKEKASMDAWFGTAVPANFKEMWGLTDYATGGGTINFSPAGLAVTGDTQSEGWEYEITANPVRGLDVSFNASKTSARRFNLAKTYTDWIQKRWKEFQGPAGDMRLWGGEDDWSADSNHGGETARGKFSRETMAGYYLWQALESSDVPELRPWRFNVIANYTFQNSGLKGVNVGGSYRWQDSSVTGFPVVKDSSGNYRYDVSRPYKGKSEDITDVWVGYQRKLTNRINWRIQLNVRNVLYTDDLIPVTVQPDGSPAAYRIPEPRTWTITNTLTF